MEASGSPLRPIGPFPSIGDASPFSPPVDPVNPSPVFDPPAVFENRFDRLKRDCRFGFGLKEILYHPYH